MQFSDLIGKEVAIIIPRFSQNVFQTVIIVGVEGGGIWIESQELMNALLQRLNAKTGAYNLAFFLPFHEITFAMTRGSGQALNEKAFGL